ncbi:hypothetical protein CKO35_07730 [Ectothiorhodospira shaposhnikovii]|uniref:hypothetical protein n=1 Tax=Ectothiorhodospira shaposhnikovii TaxID=1054 RepID=UPI0019047CA0|nr:hypothetical protein [Ectothiorhodospira shaposhnikovii]MBK1673198.1 hypothetical protein [Ectothiorhodospira shaposhnikovii]
MNAARHAFRVTLEQDVIVSRSAATAGEHETLDHLPGNLFLGVAASRLYADLPGDQAWQVFHSGAVRFCDGLPETGDGTTGWPLPLALHHYKDEVAVRENPGHEHLQFDADRVFNLIHHSLAAGRQPRQLRGGHISAQGMWIRPRTRQSLKTAIAPETGRVETGQLFGYEALVRGQRFIFELQTDATVEKAIVQRLRECLSGPARLGRSRSAEFGRVQIEPLNTLPLRPAGIPDANQILTLWLLSDLALRDDKGQPILRPWPQWLGLPDGTQWDEKRSFLRTRGYSPYNGKRRGRDTNRQVITRGSILCYVLPPGTNPDDLPPLEDGVGCHRETGLGQLVANPQLIAGERLRLQQGPASTRHPVPTPQEPDSPLLRQLRRMAATDGISVDAGQRTRQVFDALVQGLVEARIWQGIPEDAPLEDAPRRSQWGRLRDAANRHRRDPDGLWVTLFASPDAADPEDAIVRARSGWHLALGPNEDTDRLGQRLQHELERIYRETPEHLPEVVARLASLGQTPDWTRAVEGCAIREPQT